MDLSARPLFWITLATIGPTTLAFTETIVFKNGSTIKGSIVEMNETDITIDTADMGKVIAKRRTVQSIVDGAEPPITAAVQAGAATVINNNNNNNNNNSATASAAATVVAAEKPTPAAVETQQTKTALATDDHLWNARASVGYGFLSAKGMDRLGASYDSEGPALHIVPLSFHMFGGLSLELMADGMYHSTGNDTNDWNRFWHAGGGLSFNTHAPDHGAAGGVWSAGVSYGLAQLTARHGESGRRFDYYYTTETESTYSGRMAGANIGYTYFTAEGLGLNFGGSALMGKLNEGTDKFSDGGDYGFPSSGKKSVLAYMGYAGLAKRF